MSYHVERVYFEELPHEIIVREDGYMDAYRNEGEPIVDYVYTLGSGECELVRQEVELPDSLKDADVEINVYTCSVCGERMFSDYNFCPNCGRKVVER